MENLKFRTPQVGADYTRGSFYCSGATDFEQINLQFGSMPANKSSNKMMKVSFDSGSFTVAPMYERDLNSKIRIFINFQMQGQEVAEN